MKGARMIKLYLAACDKSSEHTAGVTLAKYALYDALALTAPLKKDARGKPYFDGAPAYVSISHSNGMCLAAISDTEIGADIEYITQSPNQLNRLAERFFTLSESEYVKAAPSERFYEIWCAKESYIKYTGEGFSRPLSSFSVLDTEMLFSHFDTDGYHIAVCSREYSADTPPVFVDTHKLENFAK